MNCAIFLCFSFFRYYHFRMSDTTAEVSDQDGAFIEEVTRRWDGSLEQQWAAGMLSLGRGTQESYGDAYDRVRAEVARTMTNEHGGFPVD